MKIKWSLDINTGAVQRSEAARARRLAGATGGNNTLKVTGYRRGRGFKCRFYYPSLARYCQYGPESYSHV